MTASGSKQSAGRFRIGPHRRMRWTDFQGKRMAHTGGHAGFECGSTVDTGMTPYPACARTGVWIGPHLSCDIEGLLGAYICSVD